MKIPMTSEGYRSLRDELDQLKKVERPKIVQEIEVARAHGDLKENAEYHAAKEKQGFVEGRIREIEAKLSNAEVIDVTQLSGTRVVFGCTVTVIDSETDEEKTYKIVGDDEADLKAGKISFNSPIARALIGKEEGDETIIKAPGGDRAVEIGEVSYS
ncbi:MAG: transcription elongation factor GreA [bacterium]